MLLAVPWEAVPETLNALGSLDGKIVVDATNPLTRDLELALGFDDSAGETVARLAPRARVVKSLCTLRTHCRQWLRNTRYQADATPYLGRTSTGWIAPALPGAPIRSPRLRAQAAGLAGRGRAPWLSSG